MTPYSPETRSAIADAFRRAALRILNKQTYFICIALENDRVDPRSSATARRIVQERMGFYPSGPAFAYTLESWLRAVHGINVKNGNPFYHIHMQEYRLRWLNALIEEFSS